MAASTSWPCSAGHLALRTWGPCIMRASLTRRPTSHALQTRTRRYVTRAFTLIELLIVVTVIVVLLALLTPALDRAIYQAELTVCASRLHATGVAVTSYASQYRRTYPYRPG